ncbi:MAG: hypothetical protein WC607_04235 [Candidatus Micrarchaeia archaeon]
MKINKSEIAVLELLCGATGYSMRELAEKLGGKPAFVSRIVKQLESKALVEVKKEGVQKNVRLALCDSAQEFKKIHETRGRLQDWLTGAGLDVLVVLCASERTPEELARECDYSRPAMYAALKRLYSAGVINKERGLIRVSDEQVKLFVNAFAQGVMFNCVTEKTRGSVLLKRQGKHLLIVSLQGTPNDEFELTGVNRLARDYGLSGILTNRLAYYHYFGKKKGALKVEDYFIHALALTKQFYGEDKPLLAAFLKGHKMDSLKLRVLAKEFGVETDLRELQSAVGYYDRLGG